MPAGRYGTFGLPSFDLEIIAQREADESKGGFGKSPEIESLLRNG
jgi:hypothetical protein